MNVEIIRVGHTKVLDMLELTRIQIHRSFSKFSQRLPTNTLIISWKKSNVK